MAVVTRLSGIRAALMGAGVVALLSGCATVPNSAPDARKADFERAARERALAGAVPAPAVPAESGTAVASAGGSADPADATAGHAGISDEQAFDAVSSRETIESDRERLAAMRERYTAVPAKPLPGRVDAGPNIVAYALSTTNNPGEPLYRRFSLASPKTVARRCARFSSDNEAQFEFLRRGGPKRDPLGLDPDGDGFACGWDPNVFRSAARPGG